MQKLRGKKVMVLIYKIMFATVHIASVQHKVIQEDVFIVGSLKSRFSYALQ